VRLSPPQYGADQLLHTRHAAARQREHRQQGIALATAYLRRSSAVEDLEGPEKPDPQWVCDPQLLRLA
jgi:hypothetical protein